MKDKPTIILITFAILGLLSLFTNNHSPSSSNPQKDEWTNYDGSKIVCRVSGCGNTPLYSNWDDRYCSEHINKSENHSSQYKETKATKKVNTEKALTKEEADALRGTGYHNTRPNSSAEDIEIKAAMVKCRKCGMRSHNGKNSLCDACAYNERYGLE